MTLRLVFLLSLLTLALAPKSAAGDGQTPPSSAAGASKNVDPMTPFADRQRIIIFLAGASGESRESFVRSAIASAPSIAGTAFVFVLPGPDAELAAWWQSAGANAPPGVNALADESGSIARDLLGAATTQPTVLVLDKDGGELFRVSGEALTHSDAISAITRRLDTETGKTAHAHYNLSRDHSLAVEGFDLVEYFASNRAAKGNAKFAAQYQGVTYYFSSASNRARFVANPEPFLPTYGGWCASAMGAKGEKVEIDPTNFKVKDGRLFLFYKSFFADALKDWNAHEAEWEPAADANWRRTTGESPRTSRSGAQP